MVFGNRLMRGNRTVKVSADSLRAFDTPNCPPLATIGINIDGTVTTAVHSDQSYHLNIYRCLQVI